MPQFSTSGTQPFGSLNKGMNRDAPRTAIPEGYYEDAMNMLMYSESTGGQHLATCKPDIALDSAITWPTSNLEWFAPFTYSSYVAATGVLSFTTLLLMRRADGSYYTYTAGSPGTSTLARRTSLTGDYTTHAVFDNLLLTFDGVNAPYKFGQHFVTESGLTTPYLFPLGSKPVSPLIAATVTGETHTSPVGTPTFELDAVVPGGGSRVGTHSLKLDALEDIKIAFPADRDFLSGPAPYEASNFDTTDFLHLQYYRGAGTGTVLVRFVKDVGDTVYRTYTFTPSVADTWTSSLVLLSSGVDTGGFVDADMATIRSIRIVNTDAAVTTYVDDLFLLYANAPPAAQVGTAHKDRVVLGGVPVISGTAESALSTLFYSSSGHPDFFDSANYQIITGGTQSLARSNRITSLREYGDAVVVGTQNAIYSWTIGTDGSPSRSVVTTEVGIDSPRAVVETPAGSLIFPWQRGFYILRQTGRSYVAEKIAPIIKDIWLEEPWWTVGVRDEKTRSIRFWFREKLITDSSNPTLNERGVIFDYVRSQELGEATWVSQMSQMADHAVEAYIDGRRETLYSRNTDDGVYRLHADEGGSLISYLTLPWTALQTRDKVTRWVGMVVPYLSKGDVRVFIRYASNPGEFDIATFEEVGVLPAAPTIADQGRIYLGTSARWAQVRLQSQEYGMEIFPPIELQSMPTERQP